MTELNSHAPDYVVLFKGRVASANLISFDSRSKWESTILHAMLNAVEPPVQDARMGGAG